MRIRTASEFIPPQEHVAFNRDDLYVPSEAHQHDYIELAYVLAGEGAQIINGKESRMKRGDVMILEIGNTHSYRSENGLEVLNCIIEPEFYYRKKRDILSAHPESSLFLPEHMTLSGKHFVETENLLFSMEQEFKQKNICYQQMLDNHISSLLITLYRNSQEQKVRKGNQLQRQFLEYVDKNFTHCSLQNAAIYFGYSISHFSRLFKQVMGENFSDYVNKRKLDEATFLLSNTAFSIEIICHQLGYKDRTQFYKMFQKYIGMTPSQFRKQKTP